MKPSAMILEKVEQNVHQSLKEMIDQANYRNLQIERVTFCLREILDFLDEKFPEGQSLVGKKIRKRDWTAPEPSSKTARSTK